MGGNAMHYRSICREDGLIYFPDTVGGKPVPDEILWTFEGGDQQFSTKITTDPVYYPTAGVFKTYARNTFYSPASVSYDTFTITVFDRPINKFHFPKDTGYCAGIGASVTLNTTAFPNLTYLWNTNATTPSITVNTPGLYSVYLKVEAQNNNICDTITKYVMVREYPSPVFTLGQDRTMCQNQTITLSGPTGTGYTYQWLPNNEITRSINVNIPGIYTLRTTTGDGCFAEDDIELIDSCPHYVFVPNAVSPNEDRLNDLFVKVWNFTPKDYVFSIYNRWGELLYESNDLNSGWDCKVNGELVCQDIYVYKITYFDSDKKWYEMRGTFYVVR